MKLFKPLFYNFCIALAVAAASAVSSLYRFPNREEPVVILGAGLVLGLLYRLGARALPALFIGMFAAHWLIRGYDIPVSLWLSLSLLISQWLALLYMRRFFHKEPLQQPVRNFLHFYVAAMLIAPLINALLDVPLLFFFDLADTTQDVRIFFLSYTLGEALGALVFAPAIVLYGRNYHLQFAYADYRPYRKEQKLWLAAAVLLILLTYFFGNDYLYAGILDAELLLYPMITWSALRLGVVFTNIAVALVSLTVFTFNFFGLSGSPGGMNIPQTLSMLLLIVTLAVLGQLVAATTLLRRKHEAQLAEAANVDAITGLPNLRSLRRRLEELGGQPEAKEKPAMLGYIAICDYETLVQGFGLESRNALYSQFAGFLQMEIPDDVQLFRVSGPEFALLFVGKDSEQAAVIMRDAAERIKHFRFFWQKNVMHVNTVATLVPAFLLPGELHGPIENASALADQAYQKGKIGRLIIGGKDYGRTQRQLRVEWLARLNEALARDRFRLFARSIESVSSKEPAEDPLYFEILLRLEDMHGRIFMPEEFLPWAQEFNLLPNLDRWTVEHVLQWLARLEGELQKVGLCSMKLSGQSLADPGFGNDMERLIVSSAVPAEKICFEITESSILANYYNANSLILQLQDLGCSIALDSFGSSLGSLEYLKRLPFDYLIIDSAYVKRQPDSETDFVIVDRTRNAIRKGQRHVVSDYIDALEILAMLSELGLTEARGVQMQAAVPLEQLLFRY